MNKKSLWKLILILAIPCIIGFMPAPAGLSELAWVLFGIYLAAIVGLVIKPFPEPVVLLIAVAASMVVVGNLSDGAFKTTAVLSGYSSGTTWLVFSAFTLSAAFVTTGLGKRIAYLLIGKIGNTTLGLGYVTVFLDLVLAPATPSNTARAGGIVLPIINSVAVALGSEPEKKSASCRTLPDDVHLHGHQNHQLYVLYRNGGEHSGAENDQRHSAPAN
ncbi:2-oxoglutarate/malate translocator [Escherichia coli ISC7]|uniref:2-oxoglutarate/malate translocator n=1 Tax=Escherichia coli ISC7 TaxID=1432555 RepID=W1EQZ2_ECOLX|nr:2-oxoglutarate/malate translocator [Escherichia coli ISC7]